MLILTKGATAVVSERCHRWIPPRAGFSVHPSEIKRCSYACLCRSTFPTIGLCERLDVQGRRREHVIDIEDSHLIRWKISTHNP